MEQSSWFLRNVVWACELLTSNRHILLPTERTSPQNEEQAIHKTIAQFLTVWWNGKLGCHLQIVANLLVENWTREKGRGVQGDDNNGLRSLGFDGSDWGIHWRGFPLGRLFKPPPKTLLFLHIGQTFWGCPAQQSAVSPWDIVPRLGYHPWGYNPQTRGGTGEQALPYTVMTCQKFCSVSRGNLIKHNFFHPGVGRAFRFS